MSSKKRIITNGKSETHLDKSGIESVIPSTWCLFLYIALWRLQTWLVL